MDYVKTPNAFPVICTATATGVRLLGPRLDMVDHAQNASQSPGKHVLVAPGLGMNVHPPNLCKSRCRTTYANCWDADASHILLL